MSMMRGRRNLVPSPNSFERALKRLSGRVQKIERAPAKATVLAIPVARPAPAATPTVPGTLFLLVDEGEAFDTRIYERGSWNARALLPSRPYNGSGGGIAGFGQTVLAFNNDVVNVSSDRATSFTTRDEPIADEDVESCGVDRDGVLWAVSETGSDPIYSLWKSEDLGVTWEEVQADFEFSRGLSFGASGKMAAWEVSSFTFGPPNGQVRLSDDNGATFDAVDTDDSVTSTDETITPLGVHYLDNDRIALTYTFEDYTGTPAFEVRAVYLDTGAWTTPVNITSLSGSSPGAKAASKEDEIAITLWDGDGAVEVWTSPDSETWTELTALTGTFAEMTYDSAGVLHVLTSDGLFAYVDGAWEQDETIPEGTYGLLAVPA